MKFLITGSNGLLGQKIVRQLKKKGASFLATSLGENRNSNCPPENYQSLDITNSQAIKKVFADYQPDIIINTAAITNVDACEHDERLCRKINVDAVNYLFQAAIEQNTFFIHLSTDFVFDGENGPYKEGDERNPLSVYARSKADSEDVLTDSNYSNWAILRTIIVFGQGENLSRSNLILWAKSALASGQKLTIVNDKFRAPTWADDLAWACIETARIKAKGVYHICGSDFGSIYDLVVRIAEHYGYDKSNVVPISSTQLNQPANRPPRTGFDLTKAEEILGYSPKNLEDCLDLLDESV